MREQKLVAFANHGCCKRKFLRMECLKLRFVEALCLKDPECKGIEFAPHLRRCEVWNRYPSHTQMLGRPS